MHVDGVSFLPGRGLCQPDGCERRDGVDRARHALIIGAVLRPLDDVASDNVAFVRRDWRELRRDRHGVAADMNKRVRGGSQMTIDTDAAVALLDLADGEVERIDVGDAAGAVDDAIGFRGLFGAVAGKDYPQFPVRGLDALDADFGLDANSDVLAFRGKMSRPRPFPSPAGAAARPPGW